MPKCGAVGLLEQMRFERSVPATDNAFEMSSSLIPAFLFQRETTTPQRGTRGSNPGCSTGEFSEVRFCSPTLFVCEVAIRKPARISVPSPICLPAAMDAARGPAKVGDTAIGAPPSTEIDQLAQKL